MKRSEFLRAMVGVVGLSALPICSMDSTETIPIMECYVRGFQYYEGPSKKDVLNKEQLQLSLSREANNKHDKHAIAVYLGDTKLGYVPREKNYILSKLMDANLLKFDACITAFYENAQAWESLRISIFVLKDIQA